MNADVQHTAIRLRTSLFALMRQLRQAQPADAIGTARLGVLGALYRLGPMTPTALAAHERVRLQTLTRLLAELEAEGWIVREPHPDDGRQTLLSLAKLGTQRLSAEMRRREASLARAIETALTPAQQAALLKACAAIDAVTEALAASAPVAASAEPR
ncbi:MAG TPA: MarR family transcriptional regulator [Burkholderiaceae bacterium]